MARVKPQITAPPPASGQDGALDAFRAECYAGWQGERGRAIHAEGATLASVAEHAIGANHAPLARSGRQDWCENLINRF